MFGYVTVYKDCMAEADYEVFRAYYCGLCKAMGEECSHISRLGLSYDITFLAIILSSVKDGKTQINSERCIAHPIKPHKTVKDDEALLYAANMGVILCYLKLKDDWDDDKSIKARAAMAALYRGAKRAREKYSDQYDKISYELNRLAECEKMEGHIDEAADCFAKILEALFTPDFVGDETTKKVLGWLGYNIGRWIYVIDAYNDLEKDYRSGSYNPFLAEGIALEDKEALKNRLSVSLTLNLGSLASAYELLKIYRNDSVLRHIIYTALKITQNKILGEVNGSV